MIQALRRRMQDDKGFTLIELMVVVLIVAILLAVAIPTFLRVRRNAQDRAAQNSVSAALKAEKAFYTELASRQQYTDDATELEKTEPSIDYDAASGDTCTFGAPDAGPKCVQVTVNSVNGTKDEVILVAESDSGTFWAIRDRATDPGAGTFYGSDDTAPPTAADVVDDEW